MGIARYIRNAVRMAVGLALSGVIALALLLSVLWFDHRNATTLPSPTGPFAVGRTTLVWTDPTHIDAMAPKAGTPRELVGWIWYPAQAGSRQQPVDYMPVPWRTAYERQGGLVITQFLTRDLSRVHPHAIRNAEVSPEQRSYPVVFIRGGAATLTTQYTSLAEDLASHGYVVVGIDAPFRSVVTVLPDGRMIARARQNNVELFDAGVQQQLGDRLVEAWSSDLSFALDQLAKLNASDPSGKFVGRLDLSRVGAFGHSLGGATALEFCHDDRRCKAGIDVDGLPLGRAAVDGVQQPFLFLLSDHTGEPAAETAPVLANIRSIYDRLPLDQRLYLVIRGANHFTFSDDGAMLKAPLVMSALRRLGLLHLDGRRQVAITAHCVHAFFDVYLKGAPQAKLSDQAGYPEIEAVH